MKDKIIDERLKNELEFNLKLNRMCWEYIGEKKLTRNQIIGILISQAFTLNWTFATYEEKLRAEKKLEDKPDYVG